MTTILAGKKFTSTTEAFEYFIENIYPTLDSEDTRKTKQYVYFFRSKVKGVSEDKMQEILEKYGGATIKKTLEIMF